MTCADCDLSGRCACVLRRQARRRELPVQRAASVIERQLSAPEPPPQLADRAQFEAALAVLHALAQGKAQP